MIHGSSIEPLLALQAVLFFTLKKKTFDPPRFIEVTFRFENLQLLDRLPKPKRFGLN